MRTKDWCIHERKRIVRGIQKMGDLMKELQTEIIHNSKNDRLVRKLAKMEYEKQELIGKLKLINKILERKC